MSKSNPWLSHVSQFRKKNPSLSYREVLIEARKTYTPVSKVKTGKSPKGKKAKVQEGQGVGTAIAELVRQREISNGLFLISVPTSRIVRRRTGVIPIGSQTGNETCSSV